jgi:hypothetical protein
MHSLLQALFGLWKFVGPFCCVLYEVLSEPALFLWQRMIVKRSGWKSEQIADVFYDFYVVFFSI